MLVKYNMMNIFELMEEARINEEAKCAFIERWENCVVGISGETALNGPLTIRIKFFNAVDDIKRKDDKFRINALRKEARSSEEARNALKKLCMEM